MKMSLFALLACLAFATAGSEELNIYLIASEPYDDSSFGFPTLLYKVETGSLVKVRTVTTQRQNTSFVDVYPDRGYALVGSNRGGRSGYLLLDVIDMNSVSSQKSYDIDVCDGCAYISSHLQYRHDKQVYFFLGYNDGRTYTGVDLKTGRISRGFDWTDIAGAYRTGTGSPFVDRLSHFSGVVHDGDRLIYGKGPRPSRHRLGWKEPTEYGWESGSTITHLLVNNDYMRLISVIRHSNWQGELRGLGLHVFDKAAGEWSKLDMPGGYGSFRAFGHWLASEEIQEYGPERLDLNRLERQCFPPFLSAAVNLSLVREIAPTGRLFFYNARSKELILHDTGEPNSEVLHVDGDDVAWYRVSDELLRAPILGYRLGPPDVVAKGRELWAVHWLFFGKQ